MPYIFHFSCFELLLDADECGSSPCKYNGKCHLYGGSYKCLCEGDWEGPSCESKFLLNLIDELKVIPLKEVIFQLKAFFGNLVVKTRMQQTLTVGFFTFHCQDEMAVRMPILEYGRATLKEQPCCFVLRGRNR